MAKSKFHHLKHKERVEGVKLLQREIELLEQMQSLKEKKEEGSQYVIEMVDRFEDRNWR